MLWDPDAEQPPEPAAAPVRQIRQNPQQTMRTSTAPASAAGYAQQRPVSPSHTQQQQYSQQQHHQQQLQHAAASLNGTAPSARVATAGTVRRQKPGTAPAHQKRGFGGAHGGDWM